MLQELMLAQERYRANHGYYYRPDNNYGSVDNELMIASNLGVDLRKSHNFTYQVLAGSEVNGILNVQMKAILRNEIEANCDTDPNDADFTCKQNGTIDADSWVEKYTSTTDSDLYIEVRYPSLYSNVDNGINYSHMYGD
jgi:hypothetical protein